MISLNDHMMISLRSSPDIIFTGLDIKCICRVTPTLLLSTLKKSCSSLCNILIYCFQISQPLLSSHLHIVQAFDYPSGPPEYFFLIN